jgi:hypothetical protein
VRAGSASTPPSSSGSRRHGWYASRARSHSRFVLLLVHCIPDLLRYSVPLFLNRHCDRTPAGQWCPEARLPLRLGDVPERWRRSWSARALCPLILLYYLIYFVLFDTLDPLRSARPSRPGQQPPGAVQRRRGRRDRALPPPPRDSDPQKLFRGAKIPGGQEIVTVVSPAK